MTPAEVQRAAEEGCVVLDVRPPRIFAAEHIPGAVNLPFDEVDFADQVEMVFPEEFEFVVYGGPEGEARRAAALLEDRGVAVRGVLEGGLEAWRTEGLPTASLPTLTIHELKDRLGTLPVVDARDVFEFRYGHVPGARSLPWMEAWERWSAAPDGDVVAVICGDELRSGLVASILAHHGRPASLVVGGLVDWYDAEYPVEKGEP